MGKERIFEITRKEAGKLLKTKDITYGKFPQGRTRGKEIRTSGFIRIGEIIPGVLRAIERKIKEAKSPSLKGGKS